MDQTSLRSRVKRLFLQITKKHIFYFLATAISGFFFAPQFVAKIHLHYKDTPTIKKRIAKIPSLLKGIFRPTFWLPYGDMQTIFISVYKYRGPALKMQEEIIRCNEYGDLWVDWVTYQDKVHGENLRNSAKDNTIVVVIPGLTGDSESQYVLDVSAAALAQGYSKIVVAHYRWSNPKLHIPQKGYINYVEDFERIVQHIKKQHNPRHILAVGHSFGGNLLMNFLGTRNADKLITAGVSVSNPFDFVLSSSVIHKGIYCKNLCQSLIRAFSKHQEEIKHFSERFDVSWDEVRTSKTLREFDDRFTKRLTGHKTVDLYYRAVSSAQHVHKVTVPTLILSARDDRFVHEDCLPYDEIKLNENVILAVTERGGHVGWFEGFIPKRWFPKPVMEFLDTIWQEQNANASSAAETRKSK